MCYGMGCRWERLDGECAWKGGIPYPCSEQEEEREVETNDCESEEE